MLVRPASFFSASSVNAVLPVTGLSKEGTYENPASAIGKFPSLIAATVHGPWESASISDASMNTRIVK